MDIAIVTGAETPLGLRLIQRLVRQGYRVHGIGNNFSKVNFADSQFFAHPVDLTDLSAITAAMGKILAEEKSLDLLIHAIDVTPGAAFEKLSVGNLEAVLKIGLLGPVMLTRLALPNLLRFRGQLINVIPANKSGTPASAVNALLEGGLREMNRALFDSARDAGLRVSNIILRQNPEPDALSVESSEQTHIDLEDVARAVEHLLNPNFANVPSELVLHPRCSARSGGVLPEVPLPLDPYSEVVLPPQAYCPPEQPKIPTQEKAKIDRTIPYTDDEMEEKITAAIEDFEAHPERYEPSERKSLQPPQPPQSPQPQRSKKQQKSQNQPSQQREPKSPNPQNQRNQSDDGEEGGNQRRRGRRRGGRNRNRESNRESNRDRDPNAPSQDGQPKQEGGQPQPQPSSQSPQPSESAQGRKPKQGGQRKAEAKPESKASIIDVVREKPVKKAAVTPKSRESASQPNSAQKKTATSKAPAKKVAKKVAKPADQAKSSIAPRKTATKKAVKGSTKKAVKKKAVKQVTK